MLQKYKVIGAVLLICLSVTVQAEDQVVDSWQVDHPVITGVLSGMTLAFWPDQFGEDAEIKSAVQTMGHGYGQDAYIYIKRSNSIIFSKSRYIGYAILLFLMIMIIGKYVYLTRYSR